MSPELAPIDIPRGASSSSKVSVSPSGSVAVDLMHILRVRLCARLGLLVIAGSRLLERLAKGFVYRVRLCRPKPQSYGCGARWTGWGVHSMRPAELTVMPAGKVNSRYVNASCRHHRRQLVGKACLPGYRRWATDDHWRSVLCGCDNQQCECLLGCRASAIGHFATMTSCEPTWMAAESR